MNKTFRKLVSGALIFLMLHGHAYAAGTVLATSPLVTSPSDSILPNLLFAFDDSGSMAWQHMPDDTSDAGSSVVWQYGWFGGRSSQCNGMYFNPSITYTRPVDSTGVTYPNADFYAAWSNGFDTSSSTTNLATSYKALTGDSGAIAADGSSTAAYYYAYSGTQTGSQKDYNSTTNTFATECKSSRGNTSEPGTVPAIWTRVNVSKTATINSYTRSATSGSCTATVTTAANGTAGMTAGKTIIVAGLNKSAFNGEKTVLAVTNSTTFTYTQSDCSGGTGPSGGGSVEFSPNTTDHRQNFANWFSYYRTRILMMKTSMGLAVKDIGSSYRVGFLSMNQDDEFLNIKDFSTAHKADFYTLLYSKTVGSGTPLRTLLSKAGKYYANKLTISGLTLTDPVQYSCQQNFTILSTDGFWNSGNGTDLSGSTIGNTDGAEPRPMNDGSNIVVTTVTPHTVTVRKQSVQNTTTTTLHTRTQTTVSASKNCTAYPASSGRSSPVGTCLNDNNQNSAGAQRTWCINTDTGSVPGNSNDCISGIGSGSPELMVCRGINNVGTYPDGWGASNGCAYDGTGQAWCIFSTTSNSNSCTAVYGSNSLRYCKAQLAAQPNSGYTVTVTPQTYTRTAVGSTTTIADTATNTPSQVVTTNGVAAPATNQTPIVTITNVPATAPATNPTIVVTTDNGAPTAGSTYTNGTANVSCMVTPPAAGTTAVTAGTPSVANNGSAAVTTLSTSADVVGTPVASGGSPTGGTSNTLADVAEYYYTTDLRTTTLGNCTGAVVPPATTGGDVCTNDVPVSGNDTASWQHMTTFTLALGARGRMLYSPTYLTDTSGDYFSVKNGSTANGTSVCAWQSSGACNWPTPGMSGSDGLIANIDDTWHAAVNGRGQYFSATDPATLTTGLTTALAGVKTRTGSSAAATTSNPNVTSGDNFVFSSTFTTQEWDGQLVRQQLDLVTGVVSSTIDWTAQSALDSNSSRNIYTRNPSNATTTLTGLKSFTYANLTATEKTYFDAGNITAISQFCTPAGTSPCLDSGLPATAAGANLVNYLRGDRTNEGTAAQTSKYFRVRAHLLGDIVNAEAVYVKTPLLSYSDTGFSTYSSTAPVSTRNGIVYVASNDGMLHGFNASNGAEAFAYVPTFVLPNMYKLADKSYGTTAAQSHQYYVDGTPVSGDIYYNGAWRTIVVAGLNGGGKGYYALDVTDPTNPKSLWEFTDANMGYAYGNPIITKLKDCDKTTALTAAATCTNPADQTGSGTWVVMVTSGYNNDVSGQDGRGHLYVLNAGSGALIRDMSTGVGSTTTPSGLAKINAWVDNTSTDNTTLRVYGGDLLGNVWRFDVNNLYGTSGYDVQKLITLTSDVAGSVPQPITTKPEIGDVNGTPVVYVGTGRYLATSDLTDTQQQSFYAFKDSLTNAILPNPRAGGSTFIQQDLAVTTCPSGSPTTICSAGQIVRTSTSKAVSIPANNGWFIDLPDSKERANTDPTLALGTLGFTTNVPNSSACTAGGTSFRYLLDYKSGAPLSTSTSGVSGIQLGSALATRAVFVRLPNNTVVQLTRMSDGTTLTTNVPINAAGSGARRVSWRELIQDQ